MNIEDRKTLLVLLYKMAASDDMINDSERTFIQQILKDNQDIDISTLSEDYVLPEEEHQRMRILYHLMFLMKADEEFSKNELEFINKINLELGFRPEMIEKMVKLLMAYKGKDVPPNAMLDIIKTYLN